MDYRTNKYENKLNFIYGFIKIFYLSIWQNPNNIKYRQVKLTNPKIETKLLPAAGKGSIHIFFLVIFFRGCIFNLKFIFFALPPSWVIFFPQMKLIILRGCAPQAKKFQPFICHFVNFKWFGEKICLLFTNWGKNMNFSTFFHPLSIFFFPQHDILPYLPPRPGRGQITEKYKPLT